MVHVRLQKKAFDTETGKPIFDPYIQIFSPEEYVGFEKNHKSLGWNIEVLHDPREKKTDPQKALNKIELDKARVEYENLMGKKPHKQWSAESIREKIKDYHDMDSVTKQWQKLMGVDIVPSMSINEMLEDIKELLKGKKTEQQIHDEVKELAEKAKTEAAEQQKIKNETDPTKESEDDENKENSEQ